MLVNLLEYQREIYIKYSITNDYNTYINELECLISLYHIKLTSLKKSVNECFNDNTVDI